MATYAQFDRSAVSAAVDAVRSHYDSARLDKALEQLDPLDDGHLSIAAGCISVSVSDNRICVELPLDLGKICVPIPVSIPNGTVAQACIRICST